MKTLFIIPVLLLWIFCLAWCDNWNQYSKTTWNCVDVTSYDHNWNNDMKCTSSAGEIKYTSYEWARVLESL